MLLEVEWDVIRIYKNINKTYTLVLAGRNNSQVVSTASLPTQYINLTSGGRSASAQLDSTRTCPVVDVYSFTGNCWWSGRLARSWELKVDCCEHLSANLHNCDPKHAPALDFSCSQVAVPCNRATFSFRTAKEMTSERLVFVDLCKVMATSLRQSQLQQQRGCITKRTKALRGPLSKNRRHMMFCFARQLTSRAANDNVASGAPWLHDIKTTSVNYAIYFLNWCF